ncbi:MAG: AmiS/UreI family transporter [Candidatus Odinarchaeia archaeon]
MQVPYNFSIGLLGVNMLFVCAVLYIIGLGVEGRIPIKEVMIMCFITGTVNTISGFYYGLVLEDVASMAGSFLFGFTYYLYASDILAKTENYKGLGNYCLFVVCSTWPFIFFNALAGWWVVMFFWILWMQLWFNYYLFSALGKAGVKVTAYNTYIVALINGIVALGFIFGYFTPMGIPLP